MRVEDGRGIIQFRFPSVMSRLLLPSSGWQATQPCCPDSKLAFETYTKRLAEETIKPL